MNAGRSRAVPITLSEEDGIRYLHFGSPWIQGAMRIGRPTELVLEYVRRMMGWMLFLDPPGKILQLGLGAGALTRFSLAHCPGSRVTAVDCSREVIDTARDWFALPVEDPRLRIVRGDARDFVERREEAGGYGVIQVDLYDMFARGPAIDSLRFYRACRAALAEPGICVINLFGAHESFAPNLRRIERAFDGQGARTAADRRRKPRRIRLPGPADGGCVGPARRTGARSAAPVQTGSARMGARVARALGRRRLLGLNLRPSGASGARQCPLIP